MSSTMRVSGMPGFRQYRATRYFSGLDGLRAIAVIAVIWQHTAGFNQSGGLLSRGYLGVTCFFGISGFLITTLLLREHSATWGISLRGFYLRRSLRIFPVYYAVLVVYVALVVVAQPDPEFMHNLPYYATYTSNWFGVGGDHATFYFAWSLATEEQFYLFWPPILTLLVTAGAARMRSRTRAAVAAVGVLLALVAVDQLAALGGSRVVSSLATPILLGAVSAIVLHHRAGYERAAAVLAPRWAAPVAAAVTLAAAQVGAPDEVMGALFVVLVTAIVVREDTALHPVLTWRPVVLVGTISYGIYLMHMLAANAVRPVLGHRFGVDVFLATIPVVVVAAYVSYRWFESPIRRLARR